jgi:hypothetical protein
MQNSEAKRPPVAQIFPPEIRDDLVRAGMDRDYAQIDALTDNLAARGFCRPRHADSQPQRPGWHQ